VVAFAGRAVIWIIVGEEAEAEEAEVELVRVVSLV